jgi:hypothetical protein
LLLGKFLGAAPRAEYDADLALLLERHGGRVESGVVECFAGSRDGQGHDSGDVPSLFRIHPGEFVEFCNFAGNVYRQVRRIET